jgi:hypothetical protein
MYLYFVTLFSVYNALGEVLESPVNTLVPDAFPNKTFRVSPFKPSGLRGFLQHCLPPYTSTSKFRRDQQVMVIIGATGGKTLHMKNNSLKFTIYQASIFIA